MMSSPRDSAGYIPWWLLVGVAAVFVCAAAGLGVYAAATRAADLPLPTATAVIWTAVPSTGVATPTVQSPPTPVPPTAVPTPLPAPVTPINVGDYVQVYGTGADGTLNLRADPGLGNPVNYIALEREVLQVQAGPQTASDLVWWYLVDPATNSHFGWAAQNYLQVVQGP